MYILQQHTGQRGRPAKSPRVSHVRELAKRGQEARNKAVAQEPVAEEDWLSEDDEELVVAVEPGEQVIVGQAVITPDHNRRVTRSTVKSYIP